MKSKRPPRDLTRTKSAPAALILAAGQGKRMRSKLPKVLHPVAGVPLIAHVVRLALERKCDPIVVVIGPEHTRVRELLAARFPDAPLAFAVQKKALGTGDAARAGLEKIPEHITHMLIMYGDCPLLTTSTVSRLQKAATRAAVAILTAELDDPAGYGRVIRKGRRVARVVEEKDASAAERQICEINAGVYACEQSRLRDALGGLRQENKQKEYYLTDIVAQAAGEAVAVKTSDPDEVSGVNDVYQLAEVEVLFRHRKIVELMQKGVTFRDPNNTFIGADVRVERDVILGVGVQLTGRSKIAAGAVVEGPTVVHDSSVGAGTIINAFSHLDGVRVGKQASVGPFARLRPGTQLEQGAKVGNFVETKKTRLGKGAKANHLAYLGDADVGAESNVGAGTITCNYDGVNKHPTVMGPRTFVGSNATLVAPLKLGAGAYVAAGSTITVDVPSDALAFGRARQATRKGYAKRLRARMKQSKGES